MENKLKKVRRSKELTQKELASDVNVTRQTIHSIESGKSVPSLKLALLISKALNVQLEDIFSVDENKIDQGPATPFSVFSSEKKK